MDAEKQTNTGKEALSLAGKVLIGLGEEWRLADDQPGRTREELLRAYDSLYELIRDRDYFIITMAMDALIYETALGSRTETVLSCEEEQAEEISCPAADEKMIELMDKLFPPKSAEHRRRDSRWERIVAPCGNETWRQCSEGCTKDIWEPGEIPDDICPHCGAPLTGNTIKARHYIEEGCLPQWERYTRWLAGTMNREIEVLELGAGFSNPGLIRLPFEKLVYFNRKARLKRVHGALFQVPAELEGRAEGVKAFSPRWVQELAQL
ncbi:MAG: hypothetical protein Q4C73_06290 [Eubacteriales bacterium]|nr:hypothetical protein [Eubacteriales bacterium]